MGTPHSRPVRGHLSPAQRRVRRVWAPLAIIALVVAYAALVTGYVDAAITLLAGSVLSLVGLLVDDNEERRNR